MITTIIQQLKNQVIFSQCRQYIGMGCKVKNISVPDDFSTVDIEFEQTLTGNIQMIDIPAGFKI